MGIRVIKGLVHCMLVKVNRLNIVLLIETMVEFMMSIVISRRRGHVVLLISLNLFISWFERMVRAGLVVHNLFLHLTIG